jgi:hypothetical protein
VPCHLNLSDLGADGQLTAVALPRHAAGQSLTTDDAGVGGFPFEYGNYFADQRQSDQRDVWPENAMRALGGMYG